MKLLSLGKRIVGSSSTTGSSSSSSSSTSSEIFGGQDKKIAIMGSVPKKLVYKFKSQLKQAAIGLQNKDSASAKYSYDIQSYYLNFDDGICK